MKHYNTMQCEDNISKVSKLPVSFHLLLLLDMTRKGSFRWCLVNTSTVWRDTGVAKTLQESS